MSRIKDGEALVLLATLPWFWQASAFLSPHSSPHLHRLSQSGSTQVYNNGAEFPDTPSTSLLLGQSPQRGKLFLASRPAVDFTQQGQGNLLLPQPLGPGAFTSWTENVFQSWGLPSLLHKTLLFLPLWGNLYCSRAPNIPTVCFLQTCTSEDGFGCGLESGGPQRHNTHERLLGNQTVTMRPSCSRFSFLI